MVAQGIVVSRGLGCQGSSCPGIWGIQEFGMPVAQVAKGFWVSRTSGWQDLRLPRDLGYLGVWDARGPVAQGLGVPRGRLPRDLGYPVMWDARSPVAKRFAYSELRDNRSSGCPGIWGSCPGTPTSSTLCKLWFWPSFSLRGGPMGREMHPQVPAPRHERGQQWRLRVVLSAALSPALP